MTPIELGEYLFPGHATAGLAERHGYDAWRSGLNAFGEEVGLPIDDARASSASDVERLAHAGIAFERIIALYMLTIGNPPFGLGEVAA